MGNRKSTYQAARSREYFAAILKRLSVVSSHGWPAIHSGATKRRIVTYWSSASVIIATRVVGVLCSVHVIRMSASVLKSAPIWSITIVARSAVSLAQLALLGVWQLAMPISPQNPSRSSVMVWALIA